MFESSTASAVDSAICKAGLVFPKHTSQRLFVAFMGQVSMSCGLSKSVDVIWVVRRLEDIVEFVRPHALFGLTGAGASHPPAQLVCVVCMFV